MWEEESPWKCEKRGEEKRSYKMEKVTAVSGALGETERNPTNPTSSSNMCRGKNCGETGQWPQPKPLTWQSSYCGLYQSGIASLCAVGMPFIDHILRLFHWSPRPHLSMEELDVGGPHFHRWAYMSNKLNILMLAIRRQGCCGFGVGSCWHWELGWCFINRLLFNEPHQRPESSGAAPRIFLLIVTVTCVKCPWKAAEWNMQLFLCWDQAGSQFSGVFLV